MNESKLGIYSPWVIYVKQLEALFGKDPAVKIVYDNDLPKVSLYVDGQEKADAIAKILPITKQFGNITLHIEVIPSNTDKSAVDILVDAFKGNPVLSYVQKIETSGMLENTIFVVFKNFVTQYASDNLFDVNGLTSCLLQDIAGEVIEIDADVRYCTDLPTNTTV